MTQINHTHDADRTSWVASANGHPEFPLQNLPFGIFSSPGQGARGGVAIGGDILDLSELVASGLLTGEARLAAIAAAGPSLNAYFAIDASARSALRVAIFDLLSAESGAEAALRRMLHPQASVRMHLPASIGDYTDFYVGIHHATAVGKLFRPDNPLLPNYKHVPIGYHGRASSIIHSGVSVRRPRGQLKGGADAGPRFDPIERLDYELELGVWIGPGNDQGETIAIDDAADHIGGLSLLNDWSARDVQTWEYQPLGPFLAKSFASTVSPWVITPEALAPFRGAQAPRPDGDPAPLPYLWSEQDQQGGAFSISLEVSITTERMRNEGLAPHRLSQSAARHMYWTVAQMIAHHASNGCNLRPGDLLGTGTLSGDTPDAAGSLLETTEGGRNAITLPSGETRTFIQDGDEIILSGRAEKSGFATIGFGECRAVVLPARSQ